MNSMSHNNNNYRSCSSYYPIGILYCTLNAVENPNKVIKLNLSLS